MVTHANDSSFEKEVVNVKGLVVVDFWAEWCGPCKRYGPIFEEVAGAHKDKAKFVKVNVDDAQDTASQLGVMSIPTTIFFKNGEPVERVTGILPKDGLIEAIDELR
jgi:thioredoxin 1